jgi:hypothetical protein
MMSNQDMAGLSASSAPVRCWMERKEMNQAHLCGAGLRCEWATVATVGELGKKYLFSLDCFFSALSEYF